MAMQVLKKIREGANFSVYKMSVEMDLTQTSYKYLEKTAQSTRTDLLLRAFDLAKEHLGWDEKRFIKELRAGSVETPKKRGKSE